jgi:hypothetical protein
MVTKKKSKGADKRSKAKTSKLKLSKETVKDLTDSEAKKIQGGVLGAPKQGVGATLEGTCYTCASNPGCGPKFFC